MREALFSSGWGVRLGRIRPCAFCRGRVQAKKRRDFQRGHAQRWQSGSKAPRPGELLQIDHRSVSRDGDTLKEFQAAGPYAKQLVARVYSRATARNAARFLQAVRDDLPFPLRSIQSLPRTAALRPGLDDPNGIPSPKQASRIRPVSYVVNPYNGLTTSSMQRILLLVGCPFGGSIWLAQPDITNLLVHLNRAPRSGPIPLKEMHPAKPSVHSRICFCVFGKSSAATF